MNDKGFKIGILVAVIAMVVVVGVGFAAFTATLNINGTAKVDASSWDIHFTDAGTGMVTTNTQTGLASTAVVNTEPTLADTTISDWDVTFKTPGDSVSYEFNVVNDGTFKATLSNEGTSFKLPTPTCTSVALEPGSGITDITEINKANADQNNVCKHLEYKLEFFDASTSKYSPIYTSGIHLGDSIDPGQTIKMRITLTYKDDVTDAELPKTTVKISNLGFSMVYTQA